MVAATHHEPVQRRAIYFPPSPSDPYLAVVFNADGEVLRVTPAANWRLAEDALTDPSQTEPSSAQSIISA